MTTLENIFNLIKETKFNDSQYEKEVKLTKSSIYNWKKNKAKPSYQDIKKIAIYHSITTDYLLGLSDDPQQKNTNNEVNYLTNSEKQLLDAFKQLDSITQNNLVEQAEFYVSKIDKKKNYTNLV
ncbi:MAG: helix-turn-helix domain-containing protein [Clostridiales bacterium]|jgi:transcriptional regulator with XRE-family HTH domain|nr:helix-turn-helix domain-containing protein [Clostridiales bacterium]